MSDQNQNFTIKLTLDIRGEADKAWHFNTLANWEAVDYPTMHALECGLAELLLKLGRKSGA